MQTQLHHFRLRLKEATRCALFCMRCAACLLWQQLAAVCMRFLHACSARLPPSTALYGALSVLRLCCLQLVQKQQVAQEQLDDLRAALRPQEEHAGASGKQVCVQGQGRGFLLACNRARHRVHRMGHGSKYDHARPRG